MTRPPDGALGGHRAARPGAGLGRRGGGAGHLHTGAAGDAGRPGPTLPRSGPPGGQMIIFALQCEKSS